MSSMEAAPDRRRSRRDPQVLQIAFLQRHGLLPGNTKEPGILAVSKQNVPGAAREFLAPSLFAVEHLALVTRQKRAGIILEGGEPDMPQPRPIVLGECLHPEAGR